MTFKCLKDNFSFSYMSIIYFKIRMNFIFKYLCRYLDINTLYLASLVFSFIGVIDDRVIDDPDELITDLIRET